MARSDDPALHRDQLGPQGPDLAQHGLQHGEGKAALGQLIDLSTQRGDVGAEVVERLRLQDLGHLGSELGDAERQLLQLG